MEYLSVAEARDRPGVRLVLTSGVPGPWGEAAKAVMAHHGIAYLPVEQRAMTANDELFDWTGHRNAPLLCRDGDKPLATWLEILLFAEQHGSGTPLVPADFEARALCLGLVGEIASADGFAWNRRLQMMAQSGMNGGDYARFYGLDEAALAQASARIVAVLEGLAARLHRQKAAGSDWFLGDGLTAVDLFWACFANAVAPMPAEVNPMPDWLWPLYSGIDEATRAALDPILLAHRDRVMERHIGLPLDY